MKIRHRNCRIIKHPELTSLLATYGEITTPSAERILKALIACISAALRHGHSVQISKLGTFKPEMRAGSAGGPERRLVAEHYRVRFRPAGTLLAFMRQGVEGTQPGRQRAKLRNPPTEDTDSTISAD